MEDIYFLVVLCFF